MELHSSKLFLPHATYYLVAEPQWIAPLILGEDVGVAAGITFQPLNISFTRGAFAPLLLLAFQAAAQTPSPSVPAAELVRETVAHELAANNSGDQYMYRVHEETPQGSETRIMVETRDGVVSRLILKNGQPLTPTRRRREEERLRDLLSNPARLVKLQTDKHADDARARRVIQALPDAFLYQYAGAETNSAGRAFALVTFRPNPDFHPRSTELRVLQGMNGTALIDSTTQRLVRIEARLHRDIDFGWGIFDHIAGGGSFLLEQEVVWHDQWALTTLGLHFTNRRLLLINSRVDSVTKASDFRRMPDDLTLQQALELLLNQDPMAASVPEFGRTP